MPVMGPSVLPQYYGGNAGDVITRALYAKQAFDRQKALDAVQYGVGLKWPGDGTDTTQPGPGGAPPPSSQAPIGVGDRIRAALSHVGIGSNPVPAEQAEWRLSQGGPTVGVTPTSVASEAPSGSSDSSGGAMGTSLAGMPDYMTLPNGQRIPTIMTPFGSRIMAAMKMRADIGLAGTEAEKNQAEAGLSRRKAGVPMPQDPNYLTTMQPIWGGEAGTKAAASYPYQVGVANVRNQGILGAAQIGAGSRVQAANIEQTGANTRQAGQQQFESNMLIPKAQAGAQATNTTQAFKERGEIVPSVVRPLNAGIHTLLNAVTGTPATSGAVGPLPGTRPTITTAERAALIKQGFKPTDVDAKYTTQDGGGGQPQGSSW